MSLLGWLTVAWAAVLVLALATGLTAIALRLRSVGARLEEAGEALDEVRVHTRSLEAPLDEASEGSAQVADDFAAAGEELRAAHRHLELLLDRLGLRAEAG